MIKVYPARFHPNDDGSITVIFPDLPGCVTEGKNVAEAIIMARDALALWLDTTEMVGEPIPDASTIDAIKVGAGEYITLIDADPDIYARKRQNKSVKRTISLPEWMDVKAAQERLSLSKVLQSALEERFADEG